MSTTRFVLAIVIALLAVSATLARQAYSSNAEHDYVCVRGFTGTHQGNNLWRCTCYAWSPDGRICFRWGPWPPHNRRENLGN